VNRIFIDEESREYEQSLEENGRRYLSYAEELGKAKGVKIETELRRGAIWSEVVTMSEERKMDLILLGGQEGETVDSKDIMSSTYRSVMMNARCSVLIVKERMIEQLFKLA
ncbi:MAG TPA: universal stress protein, partial [Treponemataceae bacterium]|nr:universal stress protein [Treponemataceae bacterium]